MVLTIKNQQKEVCDLCGKIYEEHDSRGFIYFHSSDNIKAGWGCIEKIIRENKITLEKYIENEKLTKVEREIRDNDRSLEGWSNIILGR